MTFFTLFTLFSLPLMCASEVAISFSLKNITMHEAILRFDTQMLLPQNLTIGQEIINRKVKLSFNNQSRHILLKGNNEADLNAVSELIQHHIDA